MEIIIIGVIAIAILVIGICLAVRSNNKNRKSDEESRKFDNDKIINELVNENSELYKFVKDYEFQAPSAASSVVLGRASNGKTEWKNKKGQGLK